MEDDLYDDSLLYKHTFRPVLNMSAMSYASRESGRLSLGFRKPSAMASPSQMDSVKMPCPKTKPKVHVNSIRTSQPSTRNVFCHFCGLPEKMVLGTMDSHSKNCQAVGFQSSGCLECPSGIDCKSNNPRHFMELSHKHTTPVKNGAAIVSTEPEKYSKTSQTMTVGSRLPSSLKGKPESRMILEAHTTIPAKRTLNLPAKTFNLTTLQSKNEIPWSMLQMLNDYENDSLAVSRHIIDCKCSLRKESIKAQSSKLGKNWTYVEGATSSDEDSDACPIYKRIPGTRFAVDALCHGNDSRVKAHFLTRFRKENCRPKIPCPIYCTATTASLMNGGHQFKEGLLRILPLDQPRTIAGVKVTAIDADNEPGSAILLFQLPGNVNVIYVGELRASFRIESFPAFWMPSFEVDFLMVDTRHCNATKTQPKPEETEACVEHILEKYMEKYPKTVIAVVSDGLQVKRLYTCLAKMFKYKIYAHGNIAKTLKLIGDPAVTEMLEKYPTDANLHLIKLTTFSQDVLKSVLKRSFSRVFVVNPRADLVTLNNIQPNSHLNVTVLDVPAPDGTSFSDLERLVKFFRPKRLVSSLRPRHDLVQSQYFRQWCDDEDTRFRRDECSGQQD